MSPSFDSFPLFRKLPTELRLRIWRHALPGPRLVNVIAAYNHKEDTPWRIDAARFIPTRRFPDQILYACWESREVARKHYQLCLLNSPTSAAGLPMLCIDFSVDVVYVNKSTFLSLERLLDLTNVSKPILLQGIQHLAIDVKVFDKGAIKDEIRQLRRFTALKEITLVIHHTRCPRVGLPRAESIVFAEPDGIVRYDEDNLDAGLQIQEAIKSEMKLGWDLPSIRLMGIMSRGEWC